MTEAEWLACTDPRPMLEFLRGKASDRKVRLFAVACCRRLWHLLTDDRSRKAVEVAERFVDGLASKQEAEAAEAEADQAGRDAVVSRQTSHYTIPEMFTIGARAACFTTSAEGDAGTDTALAIVAACSLIARNPTSGLGRWEAEQAVCSSTLREIFGNPFRPARRAPSWLAWNDGTIVKQAQCIYDDRAFERLPILADALVEAGGTNPDILKHCRQAGEHVRGCWVVDLLLGKE